MTLRTFAATAALIASLAALCACSSAGSTPSKPDVSAAVVDCSQTTLVAGGQQPGVRRVALIEFTNNTGETKSFTLIINGQGTVGNDGTRAPATTIPPYGKSSTTYMLPTAGASVAECQALTIQTVPA